MTSGESVVKEMYINPFLAGVVATVFVELVLFIGGTLWYARKNKNK